MITKRATYHYRQTDYQGGYNSHTLRVEIIDESEKSFKVKFLEPDNLGQPVGSVKWVRRKSVKIDGQSMQVLRPVTPEEIRLPYKD